MVQTIFTDNYLTGSAKVTSTGTIGSATISESVSTYKYRKETDDGPWDIRASVVVTGDCGY